jgi:hypothetical protein
MEQQARITKYMCHDPASPGWMLPTQFFDLAAGKMRLPDPYQDQALIEEYVAAWRANAAWMRQRGHLQADFFNLKYGPDFFSVLVFNTLADWQEMMDHLRDTPEQIELFNLRDAVMEKLNVTVKIYEPVAIDFNAVEYFTAAHMLAITNELDQAGTP